MKILRITIASLLFSQLSYAQPGAHEATVNQGAEVAPAQAPPVVTADASPPKQPAISGSDDGVRVTVLGYHDFSKNKKATEMLLPTEKFRKQMQAIRELGLSVISMEDFLAWKRGEKKITDKSVLITIDDGWKTVYTDAFPVLKEFGYPFTLFLYSNYVDGGGSALTTEMIKEMQKHGCTIGSHSVSHPYPTDVKAERAKGADSYSAYLTKEFSESRKVLKQKFGGAVTTYAYPGGFFTGEMLPIANETGYECLFTVLPGKVTRATSSFTLPRYVILGTHDYIFRNATSFKATDNSAATHGAIVQSTPHPVKPEPGALIPDRMPTISADLSKVENLDVPSLVMRVAGFGRVPAVYDNQTKTVSWKVNRRLRARTCEVSLQWRKTGSTQYSDPMSWIFRIDREAAYQPK